jgi:hypothetical protein
LARLAVALASCGAVVCTGPLLAQTQDTVYLVQLPASVRSVGLGSAGVAILGDPAGVFASPTALATLRHAGLEAAYRSAPGEAFVMSGALGWRIRQFDLGVGGRLFEFGSNPDQYLGGGVPAGTSSREVLGTASLVYRFGILALGATGKYARRTVGDVWTGGVSGDAGVALAFFDIMAIAFAVQNIGGNWRDTSSLVMPRLTRLGFTMNYVDPLESFRLLSTFEMMWRAGESARAVIGLEAGAVLKGALGVIGRAGWSGRPDVLSNSEFTFGGTVQVGTLMLDYAYRHEDMLGEPGHYFGARFTF